MTVNHCRGAERASTKSVLFTFVTLVAALAALFVFTVQARAAAKAVMGVTCKGGFFIQSPDRNIFWINAENQKTRVYTQKLQLWSMAECGPGVITVFRTDEQSDRNYEAFYSPNCLEIGREQGETKRLYKGKFKVTKITPGQSAVEIRLENKKVITSNSCSAQ